MYVEVAVPAAAVPVSAATSEPVNAVVMFAPVMLLSVTVVPVLVAVTPVLLIHEPLQLALLLVQGEGRAWVHAVRGLGRWLGTLPADRRAVRAIRRTRDRAILGSAPLVMRGDVAGGLGIRTGKRAYDAWLAIYWRLVSPLLP